MNLVIDLPESNGYTAIAVFINKLMKMVHLAYYTKEMIAMNMPNSLWITCSNYTVSQRLQYLIRIPIFTSKFWKSFFDLLGMDLQFSMASHPQTDG